MKKIVFVLLLLFLASCTKFGKDMLATNPQVKEFLDKYPEADVTITRISEAQVAAENPVVNGLCGISLENKAYYKAVISDQASGLEVYAYFDAKDNEAVCIKKKGTPVDQPKEQQLTTTTEKPEIPEEPAANSSEGQETDKEDCSLKLEGSLKEGMIHLSWNKYACEGFEGYKVVWSGTVESPKYPEQGYVEYITDKEKIAYDLKPKAKINYLGVTVLTKKGSVYSNPIKIEDSSYQCSKAIALEGKVVDGMAKLTWTPYECDDFTNYKVVWSDSTPFPMYPEDGFVATVTGKDNASYSENARSKTSYYTVTAVYKGGKVSSKPVKLVYDDYKEPSPYNPVLNYTLADGKVTLRWTRYAGTDLAYYKIVWDDVDEDLMYPETDAIKSISDRNINEYLVPDDDFAVGKNYYRVSAILDGFLPEEDEDYRFNSNTVKIIKEEED